MTRSVAVLAGGLGTPVADITGSDAPKAMLPVCGRPFIDVKLAELVAAGTDEIVVLVGFGAEALRRRCRTGGRGWRTGPLRRRRTGAARDRRCPSGRGQEQLPDPFWTTYGDSLLDVDLEPVEEQLRHSAGMSGVMTVLLEKLRCWQRSNVSIDAEMLVTSYDKSAPPGSHEYIDYGMLLLTHDLFADRHLGAAFDLSDVLRDAVEAGRLAVSVVHERFHDIGTEQAWRGTEQWARTTRSSGPPPTPDREACSTPRSSLTVTA